jgi:peptidyl-tRNA hydrolase
VEALYIVVRSDLKPGQQLAQSVHAMRQFTEEWPQLDRRWFDMSNTVVILGAKDEPALEELLLKAKDYGLATSEFREPDLDLSLTAITLQPCAQSKALCKGLKLALSK